MPSLNSFLEIGKRALITHQDVLQIIGHNISNVNTEGYSRQRAELKASVPSDNLNYGQIGTGVQVQSITRARDFLLDNQVRNENSALGRWNRENDSLAQIESIFLEPNDAGFNDTMSEFWDAWADLANDPSSTTARTVLRERTTHLTDAFHNFDEDIKAVEKQLNDEFVMMVDRLNELGVRIADLNGKIRTAESIGQNANDLRDERDLVLDEMSQIIQIKFTDNQDGSVNIYINGDVFVQDREMMRLSTTVSSRNEVNIDTLIWENSYREVELTEGKLTGIKQTRDVHAEEMRERLDELAIAIAEKVNEEHITGYDLNGGTGVNFFDENTTGAGDIALSAAILADTDAIAAGASGAPGDNNIALEIAALADQLIMNEGKETIGDYYSSTIADLGARRQTAEMYYNQSDAVNTQLNNLRQSVQGVVLDEELTEMIKFQRAYNAAATIVTTATEMMDTIINLGK